MVDVESVIVDAVYRRLKDVYPEVTVYGSYQPNPGKFPCVMLYETNSATVADMLSADRVERAMDVSYTVMVYTKESSGRKQKANAILSVVDETLRRLVVDDDLGTAAGLIRTGKSCAFGFNESELCCLTANYVGRVSENPAGNYTIYRR